MSRSNIRPRPIDIFRKLPIIRDFKDDAKELRFEDENGFMRTITLDDPQKLPEEKIEQKKPEKIFVPNIKTIEPLPPKEHEKFKRPSTYFKQKKVPEDWVEYDADSEDEAWLDSENSKAKLTTVDKFEVIVDRLEHAARGGNLEVDTALKLSFGRKPESASTITKVYEYWQARRGKLCNNAAKALLHRYRILKNHDDPDVNAVFRPREREYVTRKKVRKNDKKSFQRMRELRLNFDRARTVLELMKQREKLKKDRIQVVRAMFEVQCQMLKAQASDPLVRVKIPQAHDKPRSHHSLHHKEKRRKVDYGNPYEQTFNERHRKAPRGSHHGDHSSKMDFARYAAPQSEDALHPKSGGKLKPSKKKSLGTLGKLNRSQPNPKVIRQYSNKDNAPVDFHSVQHTGVLLAPAAERDWRTFRYATKCRIGRGGRIIFDRNHVKDKIPPKIFYGVDCMDWNVVSPATLEVRQDHGDICAQTLSRKRNWADFVWPCPAEGENGIVVDATPQPAVANA